MIITVLHVPPNFVLPNSELIYSISDKLNTKWHQDETNNQLVGEGKLFLSHYVDVSVST